MPGAFAEIPLPDLEAETFALIRQIPAGQVTTYGDLARALGDDRARASRWLGEFLNRHRCAADCPCHRVVRSTGEVGLHVSGDPKAKTELLRSEGVSVSDGGQVDLGVRFTEFRSERPLKRLERLQRELAVQFREAELQNPPKTLGGVDVAYRADGLACAAYVLVDAESLLPMAEVTQILETRFPYLPGFLTWRELPAMLAVCQTARERGILADVVMGDGNGRLHPWRAGISTCLGVLLDQPVMGVGKSLLCGRFDREGLSAGEARPVIDGDEVIGAGISQGGKPVFVSAGQHITLNAAVNIALGSMTRHRVPEPIYHADRLTKQLKKNGS